MKLFSADGSLIPSGEFKTVQFSLGGKPFSWRFLTATVPQSLLGWDFLAAHHMIIDMANRKLISLSKHSTAELHPLELK